MPVLSEDREGVGGGATMIVGVTMTAGGGSDGGGGGGGGGTRWAWAEVDANAMVSVKAIATAVASLRPAPVFPKCGGLDEPRINIIPKKSAAKKYPNHRRPPPICAQFFRSVNRSWPTPLADWRSLLFCSHRWSAGISPPADFLNRAVSLLRREFHVAISGTIGFRPFDCAFRD
jgi:hypothetical protein